MHVLDLTYYIYETVKVHVLRTGLDDTDVCMHSNMGSLKSGVWVSHLVCCSVSSCVDIHGVKE